MKSRGNRHHESLICPACHTRYTFGNECIECDVTLVSEAFAETCKDDKPNILRVKGFWADVYYAVEFALAANGMG